MADLSALNVLTNGGRTSIHRIETSLDDDSILDLLKSTKTQSQRYFGQERDCREDKKSRKHKKKLKRILFKPNVNSKQSPRRPHPHAHHKTVQSAHILGRSRSVPRIQTETRDSNQNIPSRIHRFAAWFDRLNHTPSGDIRSSGSKVILPMKISTPLSVNINGLNSNAAHTPTSIITDASSISYQSINTSCAKSCMAQYIQQNTRWRPSLRDIYSDHQLLESLIAFMERIYCEENILFLQSVQDYKEKIEQYIDSDEKQSQISDENSIKLNIDFQIVSIYNKYIVSNAQYQVNLSYDCFNNALARRAAISQLTLDQKREIFDIAVTEIERLITASVLRPFYDSAEFAVVAQQHRPRASTYNNNHNNNRKMQKKSRNPFARIRASSAKYKANNDNHHDDGYDNDSLSYDDDDIDTMTPYANSMPNTTPFKSSSLLKGACTMDDNFVFSAKVPSPITTDNSGNPTPTPSLSQSKSDFATAVCNAKSGNGNAYSKNVISPRFSGNIVQDHDVHIKTMSDGEMMLKMKKGAIARLKDGHSSPSHSRKKYKSSKTKVKIVSIDRARNLSPKKRKKKRKKKVKMKMKKKKQKVAADDVNVKHRRKGGKIKKLKGIKKINLRKRRKSNNDSDILVKLYRDPRVRERKRRRNNRNIDHDIV